MTLQQSVAEGRSDSYYEVGEGNHGIRDVELENEYLREHSRRNLGIHIQPMFDFKDGDALGIGEAVNEYYERGKRVDDFKLPAPKMTVNHVSDLCMCLHSRPQHYSVMGSPELADRYRYVDQVGNEHDGDEIATERCSGKRGDRACPCTRLNPVSSKSRHAHQRGMRVKAKKLADLKAGDRVLAGWSGQVGKLRLTDVKTGALVVEVTGIRPALPTSETSGLHWTARPWIIETDLGSTVKQTGGTPVGVIQG